MKFCVICSESKAIHQVETRVMTNGSKKTTYLSRWWHCRSCGCDLTTADDMKFNAIAVRKAKRRLGLDIKPLNGKKSRI